MHLIYNPVTKSLGSTENQNWYTELKSNISSVFSTEENSLVSTFNNALNDVNSTINTITQSIESSGLIENILSLTGNINDISNNISNIINNDTNLSQQDKTVLIKLQQAINDGTLVKQIPLNANPNDYQMIKINNSIYYIKKNKTKQYIMYGVIGFVILVIIFSLTKKRGQK